MMYSRFNSTEVRLWPYPDLSLDACDFSFNSTEVRLWPKAPSNKGKSNGLFQFYRSTIMTVGAYPNIGMHWVSILQKYDYDLVTRTARNGEWLFQFYRSTIMTINAIKQVYHITGFNSTEVRLWLHIIRQICLTMTSFNSTEVRLWLPASNVASSVAVFQFYRSTIMTSGCWASGWRMPVSILQKYDYDQRLLF